MVPQHCKQCILCTHTHMRAHTRMDVAIWTWVILRAIFPCTVQARLLEVVHELLGPVRWTPNTHPFERSGWNPTILTYNKRQLLRWADSGSQVTRCNSRPSVLFMFWQKLQQETCSVVLRYLLLTTLAIPVRCKEPTSRGSGTPASAFTA